MWAPWPTRYQMKGRLEMNDTFFNVPNDKLQRLASNHYWNAEENRLSLPPPKLDRSYTGVTLFSGGGGMVSSAMDYMIFCEMLRNGGSYNGVRILGPKTVQYMTISHLRSDIRNNGADDYPASHLYPGQSFGLGFGVTTDPGQSQVISSAGEYSWGGIDGEYIAEITTNRPTPSSNASRYPLAGVA